MNEPRVAKDRLLRMCARLTEGHILYKKEEAERYGCSLRSIQRDFDDLRAFFCRPQRRNRNQPATDL